MSLSSDDLSAESDPTDDPESTGMTPRKPPLSALLRRAARLVCPLCGKGRLFRSYFAMHPTCNGCGFCFERDPGYFLGSAYINYGLTAIVLTILYMSLHFGRGIPNESLTIPLLLFCVGFPLIFFRFARALWLAMDCFFDPPETPPPAETPGEDAASS